MHEDVTYTKRGVPRTGRATSDQMHIAVRDSNIEIVSMVLEALESEHDFLCAPCSRASLHVHVRSACAGGMRGWWTGHM